VRQLLGLVSTALVVYSWAIIVRALLTWLPLRPGTASYRVYSILYDVTEPYLRLFRRLLPPLRVSGAAVDMSALVGLVVIYVALGVLARL
jgi:YggT family protein